jgi:hypothetical protein
MLFSAFKAAGWAKNQDFPTKPKPLPKSISRRFAETETGLTMEYLSSTETSASNKIAIFLHGFPDAATSWIPLMLKFQNDGFKTFAPSQRGYGQTRSNKKDTVEDYDVDCLADDIAAFIEKVVPDKTKVNFKKKSDFSLKIKGYACYSRLGISCWLPRGPKTARSCRARDRHQFCLASSVFRNCFEQFFSDSLKVKNVSKMSIHF